MNEKIYKNQNIEGASLINGSLRDVNTINTKHRYILLRGSFSHCYLKDEKFGSVFVNDYLDLSQANAKHIRPPSGYKLVKIEKDLEKEKEFEKDLNEFFNSL